MKAKAVRAIRFGIYVAYVDPVGAFTLADYKAAMGTAKYYQAFLNAYQHTYEHLSRVGGEA